MQTKFQVDKNGYAPSIMQDEKECFITHAKNCDLVRHEVFYGNANRKLSKEWGCWVWLTPYWHNESDYAIHFNRTMDLEVKKLVQERFEELYGHEKFMEVFGKSWL